MDQGGVLAAEAATPAAARRDLAAYVPDVVHRWLADEEDSRVRVVDGTLVLADVSGFTPLSERLARKGKVGAEELTDILDDLFGAHLQTAGGFGGDLLKFGGDALLLMFSGDDHAARAGAAAARMQQELAARSRIDTGAGIVTLRMSVGVHSGPIHLFLVGTDHRELIVLGPAATTTAETEKIAAAGQVLLSPSTAQLVPPAWLGSSSAHGALLRQRQAVWEPFLRSPRLRADSSEQAISGLLREHLTATTETSEHRQATVAFLQFRGTDRRLAEVGVDRLAQDLDELVQATQAAARRHEVCFLATDVDADGGKLVLTAGAPRSSGDDDDRLVEAVRDIVTAGTTLTVRVGVNRGHAFAVDVGAPGRRCFSVMGDVVNVAARLMGKAPDGGILAAETVTSRLRTAYALDVQPPLELKGKSAPVVAALVGEPRGRRAEQARTATPMLGRDSEWALLATALGDARAGRGCVLQLVGEPGLGKSRLVEELLAASADLPRLVAEGSSYASFSPYLALTGPLRQLVGVEPGESDEVVTARLSTHVRARAPQLLAWLPLLAHTLGVELPETQESARLDDKFRRARLHQAVTDLLAATWNGPACLVVEDAHWLDDASSDLLRHLAASAAEHGWLMVSTRRPVSDGLDLADTAAATELVLTPLADDAAAALVARAADATPLPPGLAEALVERSGGNPLFLQELLSTAGSAGSADELPDSVEATIAARIDTLHPADRALLRRAAVLGDRFSFRLLQAVVDDSTESMRDVVRRRLSTFLIGDAGGIRFKHALLRQVAYEGLPYKRRRELHARAGEALEQLTAPGDERPVALLSLHYYQAQAYDRAWACSVEAADRARASAGLAEATTLYQRALDCARRLPGLPPGDVAATWERLGEVAERAGYFGVAGKAFGEARKLVRGDRIAATRLCLRSGRLRERNGAYADALRWYTRGLTLLGSERHGEAASLHARLQVFYGAARLRQGRYTECVRHLLQGVAEAEAIGDRDTLAHGYYVLDWAYADMTHPDAATYRLRALPIYVELGDFTGQANTLNNAGVAAYYEGRWAEAIDLYEQSRQARQAAGDAVLIGEVSNNIAEIRSDQGHLDEAEQLFREALRLWRGAEFLVGVALATSNLGRIASRRGRLDEAQELLAEAKAVFERIGAGRHALEADAREAERLVLAGRADEALRIAETSREHVVRSGGIPVLLTLVDRLAGAALLQLGDLDSGQERLHESVIVAREARAVYELGQSLLTLADSFDSHGGGDAEAARLEAYDALASIDVRRVVRLPVRARDADHTDIVVQLTEIPVRVH